MTSPRFFFLNSGSMTFRSRAVTPLDVFEIFVSTIILPCKSIL